MPVPSDEAIRRAEAYERALREERIAAEIAARRQRVEMRRMIREMERWMLQEARGRWEAKYGGREE